MKKIKKFIKEHSLIEPGDRVVIGVSGGADSICLTLVLKEIVGADSIIAVHVNHCLRGDEAERDENFVIATCKKYGIKLIVRTINIKELAQKEGLSTEEAGRIARYNIFEEVRLQENANKIAVAHNRNDLAETFLLNLSRGSDLAGLTGIKPKNGKIIRPLLSTSRAEIEDLVESFGETFVTDSTNLSLFYTRNRIRNNILTELEAVNKKVINHINETAEKLQKIENYISIQAEEAYNKHVSERVSEIGNFSNILLKASLLTENIVIVEKVIYNVLKNLGSSKNITSLHVSLVKDLFKNQVGKKLSLPYKITALRTYEGILFPNCCENVKNTDFELPKIRLTTEELMPINKVEFCKNTIKITFINGTVKNLYQNSFTRWFDYDRILSNVVVRTRKTGDYLNISKSGVRKRLKNYFIDSKIPSEKRDYIPIVAVGSEVLWIVGYRTCEDKLITEKTKTILKIEIISEEKDVRKNYYPAK